MIDVEKKAQLACQLKAEGYNCAQAVFAAFAEDYGIDKATAVRLTAGLGGGVAEPWEAWSRGQSGPLPRTFRLRQGSCERGLPDWACPS